MKRLIFTVTNDLVYDQRMIRICTTLAQQGYQVTLVGRCYRNSPPLVQRSFVQKRLHCRFRTGILFYAEYNLRLLCWLLGQKANLLCAIDLDTILPVWAVSTLKRTIRVYDAHELFCEMKEVVSRPRVYRFWKWVERSIVPRFRLGYTVNTPIRDILQRDYGVCYEVIRNMPWQEERPQAAPESFVLYQGTVNEGRSFETLIPAFQHIPVPLHIYGDGNFLHQAKALVQRHGLETKVLFKGKLTPEALRNVTPRALLGITLFENKGLSNYYSLANRFFDYVQAGVPQLCVDYPVYRELNEQHEVAILTAGLSPDQLSRQINSFLADTGLQQRLRANCLAAAREWNWEAEEQKLIRFYAAALSGRQPASAAAR